MYFEGSEKKVEIVVSGVDLRGLGRSYWQSVVWECGGEILSRLEGEQWDAYLLSESSLFVGSDRVVMITCGRTILLRSVLKLVEDLGCKRIVCLVFQRKNEYDQTRQKTSFADDIQALRKWWSNGQAHRFGYLDGHHHVIFSLNQPFRPPPRDVTVELLMYHVGGHAAEVLRQASPEREKIREVLRVDALAGFQVDDHSFEPYGYSMNGIKGEKYVTIHVTPQVEYSYVSYETNLDIWHEHQCLLPDLVKSLCPDSFDLVTFREEASEREISWGENYLKWDHVRKDLNCGYQAQFFHYVSVTCNPREPWAF